MKKINVHLIPSPKKIIWKEGRINLKDFSLSIEEGLEEIGKRYQKELSLPEGRAKRIFLEKVSLEKEGYILKINREKIKINASDERGFFYCLQTLLQLKDGDMIPRVEIEDSPSLKIRGFHINFNGLRQMGFKEAKELIETAAKFKLSAILIEYGDRFPFQKHPLISSSNSLAMEEISQLDKLARENFIEIVPLLQSLGHLNYVLNHEEYSHLREGGKEGSRQLCPLNPDSFKLFTELADEMLKLHPEGKYFHIGADEARHLGECPKCKREVEKIGKGGLYVNYINKVCQWVKEQGKIPILWDDILCHYPETLNKLNKETVIMYWDYWTTQEKSPILVARAANRGVVYDKKWNKEWKEGLPNLEGEVLEKFSQSIDLEKDLGENYLSLFKDYLGKDFPKYITSFPYVKFYQDKGYKVIGGPATLGNCLDDYYNLPNYNRSLANIREFSRRCIKEKGEGIVTTCWWDFPFEILYLGLIATGQFTWKGTE